MAAKRPPSVPLTVPIPLAVGVQLPDARVLTNKRLAAESADLAEEAKTLVASGAYNETAGAFLAELLPALAPGGEIEALKVLTGWPAAFGFAFARIETRRGWATPGFVDGLVNATLDLGGIGTTPKELSFEEAELYAFAFRAAYFYARTGPNGMALLKNVHLQIAEEEPGSGQDASPPPGGGAEETPAAAASIEPEDAVASEGATIDPGMVPYPWPDGMSPLASTREGRNLQWTSFPDAISAGTAQFPAGYKRKGGKLKDL